MTQYFNDSPIEKADDDRYGVTPFAKSMAQAIRSIKGPIGTTIALNGPWGSGKSSVVNIVRSELESSNDETLVISDFKCWWYQGEEALLLAFLQNLDTLLTNSLREHVKGLVPQLGRHLLQAGPVIGSALALTPVGWLAGLTGAGMAFAQRFFPQGDTLDTTFRKLADTLEKRGRRFLIIVDDIDRLSPEEALAVFRVIKSVGCLPNVIYLLAFDRALAEKVVAERYPSEGPHFLEKIVQASFELPVPLRTDLNSAILSAIQETCEPITEDHPTRLLNIFYDVVVPYLTTPRHVVRFQNAISVTWPAIANQVNVADFVALETLRLYEPTLFSLIRSSKDRLCKTGDERKAETRFDRYLNGLREEFHDTAKLALQRLFPRMEAVGYGSEFYSSWNAERRVCMEAHFDTYFRLILSHEALPVELINGFIENADDPDFVRGEFRKAAALRRNSGTSMVPVVLDELNAHGPRIPKEKVQPFLSALFEIHDEIDLPIDAERGAMAVANTTLSYHWLIRRLTDRRFNTVERTELYLNALQGASLGWLVDFAVCAKLEHRGGDDERQREEDSLVCADAVDGLTDKALEAIRTAAQNGTLLGHQDLVDLLYRWRDLLGNDPTEVRAWTDRLLEDEQAVIRLARKLTGETWSQQMGGVGLADRVSKPGIRTLVDENTDVLDVEVLCQRLEALQGAGTLDEVEQMTVDQFLKAWGKQRERRSGRRFTFES